MASLIFSYKLDTPGSYWLKYKGIPQSFEFRFRGLVEGYFLK